MPGSSDPRNRLRFDGKSVLVTGGSRGLGKAVADTLHALGAQVYATSRNEKDALEMADRYGSSPVVLDVANPESITMALDQVFEVSPHLSLLVNNAGVNFPQEAAEIDLANWDDMFAVNARGTFLVSQGCARRWIAAGTQGRICNISSQAGRVALEKRAAYSATKAAMDQLTRSLASEWAHFGIRVNGVAPTFVHTELTASTLADPGFSSLLLSRIPLGRFGEAQEIADVAAFLLSDMASLITGETILADGGYTIR
jgi:2-deoxy-D-gluconate 3-dehydrogenase